MASKLFVNLAVKDLKRAMDFFKAVGFDFNPQFTDDTAACMIIGGDNYAMLLTHEKFGQFSKKKIVDSTRSVEALMAVSFDSRDRVNEIMANALKAGGTEPHEPRDYGFMFQRSFEDPDGHTWEVFYMDESAIPKQ